MRRQRQAQAWAPQGRRREAGRLLQAPRQRRWQEGCKILRDGVEVEALVETARQQRHSSPKAAISFSSSTVIATGRPTGTSVEPPGTSTLAKKPSSSVSNVTTALSVSISATPSPALSGSPAFFSQDLILPGRLDIQQEGAVSATQLVRNHQSGDARPTRSHGRGQRGHVKELMRRQRREAAEQSAAPVRRKAKHFAAEEGPTRNVIKRYAQRGVDR